MVPWYLCSMWWPVSRLRRICFIGNPWTVFLSTWLSCFHKSNSWSILILINPSNRSSHILQVLRSSKKSRPPKPAQIQENFDLKGKTALREISLELRTILAANYASQNNWHWRTMFQKTSAHKGENVLWIMVKKERKPYSGLVCDPSLPLIIIHFSHLVACCWARLITRRSNAYIDSVFINTESNRYQICVSVCRLSLFKIDFINHCNKSS